jgi:hypothetical protein
MTPTKEKGGGEIWDTSQIVLENGVKRDNM